VSKATSQFLNEQVRERLKTALDDDGKAVKGEANETAQVAPLVVVAEDDAQGDIATTDEELEGYRIVRAIVCSEVPAGRVTGRDGKTYFAILLDNNNRKPIARLWFNRKQKYLGVLSSSKVETRFPIETLEDIYLHSAQLRSTVSGYLTAPTPGSPAQEWSDAELKESAPATE
jgi:predicted type IV restriction endonuclease